RRRRGSRASRACGGRASTPAPCGARTSRKPRRRGRAPPARGGAAAVRGSPWSGRRGGKEQQGLQGHKGRTAADGSTWLRVLEWLLVAQRFNGIEQGRLAGGIEAEGDTDDGGEDDGDRDGARRDDGDPAEHAGQGAGDDDADQDAEGAGEGAEEQRLDQELGLDAVARRSQGAAH